MVDLLRFDTYSLFAFRFFGHRVLDYIYISILFRCLVVPIGSLFGFPSGFVGRGILLLLRFLAMLLLLLRCVAMFFFPVFIASLDVDELNWTIVVSS